MPQRNYTIFKVIGIVVCSLCAAPLTVHYFNPSPPATSLHTHYQQTYRQNRQQIAPYRQAGAETFFTNDNIAIFIVAPLVILAMIGGLFIIYRKELEARKIIVHDPNQLPETIVSNRETTVAPHTTVSSAHNTPFAPLTTSSQDKRENTVGNNDDNSAQNLDSDHDNTQSESSHYETDDSSSSSIAQSTNNTIGKAISSPPLFPKDVNPYPQHIKEHYLQHPATLKLYGAKSKGLPTDSGNSRSTKKRVTFVDEQQPAHRTAYMQNDIAYPQYVHRQDSSTISSNLHTIAEADEDNKEEIDMQDVLPQNNPSKDTQQTIHLINILVPMLRGEALNNDTVTNTDISIYEKLTSDSSNVSDEAKKRWNNFRKQQIRIIIDMQYMYLYYERFRAKLCFPKPIYKDNSKNKGYSVPQEYTNLLLIDKMVQVFPNLTQVTCKQIDYVGPRRRGLKHNREGYSVDVVVSDFINNLSTRLKKMPDKSQHRLQTITIKTSYYDIKIKDTKLKDEHAIKFLKLGWQVGKGRTTIVVTRETRNVLFTKAMPKIKAMLQGQAPPSEATSLDALIFKKLATSVNDFSSDVHKEWDNFRKALKSITINMYDMYTYYEPFTTLLIANGSRFQNVLLLNTVSIIFPNVTQIVSLSTDYNGQRSNFSIRVVDLGFIEGLFTKLEIMKKRKKQPLQRIIITTEATEINIKKPRAYDDKEKKLNKLGWSVARGFKTLVVTKTPYDDHLLKISSMTTGKAPAYEVTSLDVTIFKKLVARANDVPSNALQGWKVFCAQQQSITINIKQMYRYYALFTDLLLDKQYTNLLRLDKIVQLFPNVTQITCKTIAWDQEKGQYSSRMVRSDFRKALATILANIGKLDNPGALKKIILTTGDKSKNPQFKKNNLKKAGWHIAKDKNTKQVTLTKLKHQA